MNKVKYLKKIIPLFIILAIAPINYCFGQILKNDTSEKILDQTEALTEKAGFGIPNETTIASVVAKVIQGFLSLLGIIFVILIVIAGNKWMNARGNEQKVEEAQETIRRAIIGLIITASAYAITYFVFSNLPGGGGTGGGLSGS